MKNPVLFSCILSLILWGCSPKKESPKKFEYKRTQKEIPQKSISVAGEIPVDLTNKGIGPIQSYTLNTIDQALVEQGAALFKINCTTCHKPDKKFIGPALKGVLERRSPEWVLNMIINPEEMTQKDPIAQALLKQYNGSPMANQGITIEEAKALLEYIRSLSS